MPLDFWLHYLWENVMGGFLIGLFLGVAVGWLIARKRMHPEMSRQETRTRELDYERMQEIFAPMIEQTVTRQLERVERDSKRSRAIERLLERIDGE